MKNIRVIRRNVNVSKILAQLKEFPEDWNSQMKIESAHSLLDQGFPEVAAGVLQIVIGGVTSMDQYVGDTEYCIPTPAYKKHTEIVGWLRDNYPLFSRCGFLSLPVGGEVGQHIDIGNYYLTRDRFHLCIQGKYEYTVGGETVVVEAGDLLVFNNKLSHGTKNIGDCVRVTFVFDVPYPETGSIL